MFIDIELIRKSGHHRISHGDRFFVFTLITVTMNPSFIYSANSLSKFNVIPLSLPSRSVISYKNYMQQEFNEIWIYLPGIFIVLFNTIIMYDENERQQFNPGGNL